MTTGHHALRRLPERFIPLPTDEECAWLAGFIDGEGTILLAVSKKRERILPRVSVANTNLDNIGRVRVLFRALLAHDVRPTVTYPHGYRPCYQVSVMARRDIPIVLNAVRPWLVGKRRQADLMLEFMDESQWPAGKTSRDFATEMRELNRRYRKGEWAQLHPETMDPERIESAWQRGQRPEFLGDTWESIRALLRLRLDY